MTPTFWMAWLLLLQGTDGDVDFSQNIRFTLTRGQDKSFQLQSETLISTTFLSERAIGMDFQIAEPYFAPISDLKVVVRKQGAKRFKAEKGYAFSPYYPDFEDIFYANQKVFRLTKPQRFQAGQTLQYSFGQAYLSPAFLPVLEVPNMDKLGSFDLVFQHPRDITVTFEFFFPGGKIDYQVERGAEETRLTFAEVPMRKPLASYPFNQTQAFILPRFQSGDGYLCKSSPAAFNQWYLDLIGEVPALTEPNRRLVEKLVAGQEEPLDKLRALNNYVRTEIRYIADEAKMGAIVPRPPNLVLDHQYGDCKDRALLVREMARTLGLEVFLALVSTAPTASFEQSVKFNLFNHVICAWKDGSGQWLFFDPTQRFYPFALLPDVLVGEKAFVVGPGQGNWVTITAGNAAPVLEIDIRADTENPAGGRAIIHLRGDFLAAAAQADAELSDLDRENLLANMIASLLRKLAFRNLKPLESDDDAAVFEASVDLNQFLMTSPRKLYLPGTVFTVADGELLARREDDLPIFRDTPSHLLLRLHLHHPGFQRPDHSLAMGNPAWAVFKAEIAGDGDLSTLTYRFDQNGKWFADASRKGILDFCAEYLQHKNDMFVFPRSEP